MEKTKISMICFLIITLLSNPTIQELLNRIIGRDKKRPLIQGIIHINIALLILHCSITAHMVILPLLVRQS